MADLRVSAVRAGSTLTTPLLVLPMFDRESTLAGAYAEIDGRMSGALRGLLERGDFRGRKDETLILYPREGEISAERILLVGLGKAEDYTVERLRRAVGTAIRTAERMGITALAFSLEHTMRSSERMGAGLAARAAAEAGVLAVWDFRELKTVLPEEDKPRPIEELKLVVGADGGDVDNAITIGVVCARSANLARDLATKPGNIATPTYLAEVARQIASAHGNRKSVV